jgi:hypothetical protein
LGLIFENAEDMYLDPVLLSLLRCRHTMECFVCSASMIWEIAYFVAV